MAAKGGGIRPELGCRIAPRECESCRSAPGMPFCRVEWSFLCTGCAAVVHGHSWIVAVPPNPNPNPNTYPYPSAYPYAFPNPNLNPNAGGDPHEVVQLSSDEEALSAGDPHDGANGNAGSSDGGGKRRRWSAGFAAPGGRVASVMRYKEKRKSRKFEKTGRYETRKVHADLRPQVDGKFARPDARGDEARADSGEEARADASEPEERPDANEQLRLDASEEVMLNSSNEVGLLEAGGEELRQLDAADEVRLELYRWRALS